MFVFSLNNREQSVEESNSHSVGSGQEHVNGRYFFGGFKIMGKLSFHYESS